MQKEQFYCLFASSHTWHIPGVNNHSWTLFYGTLQEAEAYNWEDACEHAEDDFDDEEEEWGDHVESSTSRSIEEYDPTIEGHASLTGYEDVRPEHLVFLKKQAQQRVDFAKAQVLRTKQRYEQLLLEIRAQLDGELLSVSNAQRSLEGLYSED